MTFFNFCSKCARTRVFFPQYFSCPFCRFSVFVFLPFSFIFSTLSRKWRRTLFVLLLRHLFFTVFWAFSQRNCQTVEDVWTMSEQVVKTIKTLEDKPRKLQGVNGCCFTMCKKCYRKSCKYMRNNSTRLKGKKKLELNNIKVSSTTVGRYVTNKGWKALKRKKAVHTSCRHGIRRICKL